MSYLVTDEKTKTAAVIDPQRDVAQYLQDTAQSGYTIRHVFLTHFHADFLAGHLELRNKTGATIYIGRRGEAQFPVQHLKDGDLVEFGDVRMQILETPGHTPEGISIVVYDLGGKSEPCAVMTGDTLFLGDVGRPDLMASVGVTSDELANMMYDSLREKLLKLPDATLVYPAHGAGSMCGKNLSTDKVSTIGEQRKFNYALQPMSREEFKAIVTAEQPEAPGYFAHDAMLNRQEHVILETTLTKSLRGLGLEEVLQLLDSGAQLLDVRDAVDFEGAHLKGSLSVPINGKYATWCGTMLNDTNPIVVIAEPGREEEAITRLGRIGFDNVVGYLKGGMDALSDRPDLVRHIDRVTAMTLAEQLGGTSDAPLVLDVRTQKEWAGGHIAGSLNIPLNHLREHISELPGDRRLAVHCEGGYRSVIAASLLADAGHADVMDLVGGFKAWTTSKLPFSHS